MPRRKAIRLLAGVVALLALLLVATTAANIWHHHSTPAKASCPICHLAHQPFEAQLGTARTPDLRLVGSNPPPNEPPLLPGPVSPHASTRAPPAA